jgi:hypothetical protein
MRRIQVFTESDALGDPGASDEAVGLFWAAPDLTPSHGRHWIGLAELVGGEYEATIRRAYALAHALAGATPAYGDTRPLIAWESHLADLLLRRLLIVGALDALAARLRRGTELVVSRPGTIAGVMARWNAARGEPFRISVRDAPTRVRPRWVDRMVRLGRLVREARRDGDWRRAIWQPLEVLDDTYRWRSHLWPALHGRTGGLWRYTSYLNYTRVLARHGTNARWLSNSYSGAVGAPPGQRAWLWQFNSHAPRDPEIRGRAVDATAEFVRAELPVENGLGLRELLEGDEELDYLLERVLPVAVAEVDLLYGFVERARPDEIWVANQWGSEGNVLAVARACSIRTVQVQHGALEQHYTSAPLYGDRFLVWGEFWRQCVPQTLRSHVDVVNPGFEIAPASSRLAAARPRLTFFSAPADDAPFWHPSVVRAEVIEILQRLLDAGWVATIRVHPRDSIDLWERTWQRERGGTPSGLRFDKGGSLDELLRETDVALMALSTTFLNCIASGIPVVALAWYPHLWLEPLERQGVLVCARSIAEAVERIEAARRGGRQAAAIERFLAPHPPAVQAAQGGRAVT